eukprot:7378151-Prymnesium_polylepis.2
MREVAGAWASPWTLGRHWRLDHPIAGSLRPQQYLPQRSWRRPRHPKARSKCLQRFRAHSQLPCSARLGCTSLRSPLHSRPRPLRRRAVARHLRVCVQMLGGPHASCPVS